MNNPSLKGAIGRSVWFDLPVADLADAMSFYSGLLKWDYRQMESSVLPDYVMIESHGELIGGLRRDPAPKNPPSSAPVLYFTVEKLAPAVQRAEELGAEIVGSTVDLGKERGRYQWLRDRAGNVIGLWGQE